MMAAQGLKRVRVLVTMMVMTVMVVPKMTIMNIVQENIVLMTSTTRMTFVSCLYDVCFRFRSVVVVVVAVAAVPSHPHLCGHPCSQHVYDAINKNVAVLLGNLSSAPRCELTESLVVWVRIRFSPVRSPTYLQQLRIGLGLSSGSPGFEARSLKRAKNPRLRPQSASPILLPSEPRLNSAETSSTQHSTHLKFKRQSETRSRSPIR